MTHLELRGVGRTFAGEAPVVALADVDLMIEQGDYVAIEGPSGSGKSTLLNQIALLDVPTQGTYLVDDVATTTLPDHVRARLRSRNFGFIFQSFHLLPGRSVLANVALGSLYRGICAKERESAALEALEFVGLSHKSAQRVDTLSGGERQRVAIARAIVSGAPVLVADEPTGNLDRKSGQVVIETLERLNATGTTLIVVTHDPALAARAKRRVHVLDGHVSEQPASAHALAPGSPPVGEAAQTAPASGKDSQVRLLDALMDAWQGLWSKASRTWGLVAAVAMGVALAITTNGLALSARYQVSDIFDAAQNKRVSMQAGPFDYEGAHFDWAGSVASLHRLRELAGVTSAMTWVARGGVSASTRPGVPSQAEPPLVGVTDGSLPGDIVTVRGLKPGQQLGPGEVVVGANLAKSIQMGPLQASPALWVDGTAWRVVGVLEDAGLNVQLLESVLMLESEAATIEKADSANAELRVQPGSAASVGRQAPAAWIPTAKNGIAVMVPPDPRSLRGEIESNLSVMLWTLTGVALLAAVLSLTNAMTNAVFQRIGEFGLRRAIGARRSHIRALVMAESVVIGVLGGAIGAYVSIVAILGVTIARGWQPVLDPNSVGLGVLGGIVVGFLGGLLATFRASRIQPSDALRA
ncbi:ATP-binding cassette domain-containing protein [Buchananella felis]|uniref:ABC transporter ATP-binding protein/permease n=1 Tax=Buchananella felis TaxID=3231492 RepID=UPI003528C348